MPIHAARLHPLNQPAAARGGAYVLLWVQASVRVTDNHALEYAAFQAGQRGLPLVAVFALTPHYPEANARHYRFLLEGLAELRPALAARGVALHIGLGDVPQVVVRCAEQAALVVTDVGYTRVPRQWRAEVAGTLAGRGIPFVAVESEAVVPVMTASDKQEYAARTIRPRITRRLPEFLEAVPVIGGTLPSITWPEGETNLSARISALGAGETDPGAGREHGGEPAALTRLHDFIAHDLRGYAARRSDPTLNRASRLSAYLHYGHLSPITAALAVQHADAPQIDKDTLLEELIVRRELSFNYCWYQPDYDRYAGLPRWARETLEAHAGDEREHLYSAEELEGAGTHDPAWNAAQREMVQTGRMQGYMRMYWGKKILEWTPHPEEAHRITLELNNRYEQDGRDPNSFVGVAWVFGLHDRPWTRRPIFGTVRYMNAAALRRKFDIPAYIRQWGG